MEFFIFLLQLLSVIILVIQYGVVIKFAIEMDFDELITNKKEFWCWLIPFGASYLLFIEIKNYYKSLGSKSKDDENEIY